MIDPTVWGPIILKITAEQRYFLKKEFGITEVDLRLQSLQDVSELINGLASIAFYEFNHEHQRTERADCALNLVWLLTEAIPKEAISNPIDPSECNPNFWDDYDNYDDYYDCVAPNRRWCDDPMYEGSWYSERQNTGRYEMKCFEPSAILKAEVFACGL